MRSQVSLLFSSLLFSRADETPLQFASFASYSRLAFLHLSTLITLHSRWNSCAPIKSVPSSLTSSNVSILKLNLGRGRVFITSDLSDLVSTHESPRLVITSTISISSNDVFFLVFTRDNESFLYRFRISNEGEIRYSNCKISKRLYEGYAYATERFYIRFRRSFG